MNLPAIDVRDETACYQALLQLLHPQGLCCPNCGNRQGRRIHRSQRAPVVDYLCLHCHYVFNAWTATVLRRTHLPPTVLWPVVQPIVNCEGLATVAQEIHRPRFTLNTWHRRLRHLLRNSAQVQSEGNQPL